MQSITTIGLDIAKSVYQVHGIDAPMKANFNITMRRIVGILSSFLMLLALPHIASAKNLKSQIIGGWTLVEGSESLPDGKKVVPWAKGSLIIDRDGQISFFVLGKDRPKTDSVRTPAAPMVAWYGTYTVDKLGKSTRLKLRERAHQPSKVLYASRRSRSKTTP
jgi:hypothetical protein